MLVEVEGGDLERRRSIRIKCTSMNDNNKNNNKNKNDNDAILNDMGFYIYNTALYECTLHEYISIFFSLSSSPFQFPFQLITMIPSPLSILFSHDVVGEKMNYILLFSRGVFQRQ